MQDQTWRIGPSVTRFVEAKIVRALRKNCVREGSALEMDVRARAHVVWGWDEPSISVIDDRSCMWRLEDYVSEQQSNPEYADSFIPRTRKAQIGLTDQEGIFAADVKKIASGEIEIFDDRKDPPR
jgi:hypothetical protein